METLTQISSETVKIIIMVTLMSILLILSVIPIAVIIINRGVRTWLKTALEGEDKELNTSEIKQMLRFYIIITCLPVLIVMVMTSGIFEIEYPVYGYIVVSLLLVGAEAKEFGNIVGSFKK